MTAPLFSGPSYRDRLDEIRARILDDIRNANQAVLDHFDDLSLVDELWRKYEPDIPMLRMADHHAEYTEGDGPLYPNPNPQIISSSTVVRGLICRLHIPFSGDAKLFYSRPSYFPNSKPIAQISGQTVVLTVKGANLEKAEVERQIDQGAELIERILQILRNDTSQLKQAVPQFSFPRIAERRASLARNKQLVGGFKYNLRRRENAPETYTVSLTPRQIKLGRLPVVIGNRSWPSAKLNPKLKLSPSLQASSILRY